MNSRNQTHFKLGCVDLKEIKKQQKVIKKSRIEMVSFFFLLLSPMVSLCHRDKGTSSAR